MFVDHIAFLSENLTRQSAALANCKKGPIESFPNEGTREQYIEWAPRAPRLLLLQAMESGPYARALQKRGPGLHHIGAQTSSFEALIPSLSSQGLRLHPISLQSMKQGVVWLCRSGMPFLIELSEGMSELHRTTQNIEKSIEVPFELGIPAAIPAFVATLFANLRIVSASGSALELKSAERVLQLA